MSPARINRGYFRRLLEEQLKSRKLRETAQAEEDRYKRQILDTLESTEDDFVEITDEGHRVVTWADPIADARGQITGVRRTRRVARTLNVERAEALLASHKNKAKLKAKCYETVVVFSEDGVLAANFEGLLTDEELASLYDEKVTYAMDLIK